MPLATTVLPRESAQRRSRTRRVDRVAPQLGANVNVETIAIVVDGALGTAPDLYATVLTSSPIHRIVVVRRSPC